MGAPARNAIAIIAGAGPGTGAAIAKRFAQAYPVVVLARSQSSLDPLVQEIQNGGQTALGIPTDVANVDSMHKAIEKVKAKFGTNVPVSAAIFNMASKFTRKAFLESSKDEFLGSLQTTADGAFNFCQAVLPLMPVDGKEQSSYPPTLIFTGATAALKGGNGLGSFAMSKFAIRALSQSLAREYGPRGIHVAHVIVDGIIDTEKTKGFKEDVADAKISPDQIAEAYWYLHTQDRTAFTQEQDLRPYCEPW